MKTLNQVPLLTLFIFLMGAFPLFAEDQIVASVHNQFGPSSKVVEIKNIDLIRRVRNSGNFYGKDFISEDFELRVYVWSKYNLEQFQGIFEVKVTHEVVSLINGPQKTTDSSSKRQLMGVDPSNGYYVYRVTFDNPTDMTPAPRSGHIRAILKLDVVKETSVVTLEHASHPEDDCFKFLVSQ